MLSVTLTPWMSDYLSPSAELSKVVVKMNLGSFVHSLKNKSFLTHLLSLLIIGLGYLIPDVRIAAMLRESGFVALSCAITNWIAIYMLFEKIPFFYGSGVIPAHFTDFKKGIKSLVMQEFFTEENVSAVISTVKLPPKKWVEIADSLDYDKIFAALVAGILDSKFGKFITMMGAQNAIESLRESVKEKLQYAIEDILADEDLQQRLVTKLAWQHQSDFVITIEQIVDQHLAKLTPQMVKEIMQKMIREHLGWLVVWGGVFGGLIGLVTSLIGHLQL